MVNEKAIKDLVVNLVTSGRLQLRPLRFITGAFDVAAHFIHNGKTYQGRGTAFDDDTAIFKATASALERCYRVENETSADGGWAVRESPLQAMFSAQAEAVERDLLTAHLLAGHPFYACAKPENPVARKLPNIDFYELKRVTTFRVTIAVGRLTNGGVVVGIGSNGSLQASLEQAFFECARNVLAWEFDQALFDRARARAATPEYGSQFIKSFTTDVLLENTPDLRQPLFKNVVYALSLPESTGLTIARASFENQFSNLSLEETNLRRLSEIFQTRVDSPFTLGDPLRAECQSISHR